jgi:hypothetical protein
LHTNIENIIFAAIFKQNLIFSHDCNRKHSWSAIQSVGRSRDLRPPVRSHSRSNGSFKVGTPVLTSAKVTASVVAHQKGDKVIVFKKKRRKGYEKKNGHRQSFTKIKIESITA